MYDATLYGDIATWVTGLASILLFFVALRQIHIERTARQNADTKNFQRIKRQQSDCISGWLIHNKGYDDLRCAAISNQSNQPIYSVVISIVMLDQEGERKTLPSPHQTLIDVVPPGLWYTTIRIPMLGYPSYGRMGIELAFKDVMGVNWIRLPDGGLIELKKTTLEHYQIVLPESWGILSEEIPLA